MKRRIQLRTQVKDFMDRLPPEPRRRLKLALRGLENERGDRTALREGLAGYHRLRVGGYRVIYRYLPGGVTECVFAERRSLVYQLFEREMLERLRHEDGGRSGPDEFAVEEEAPARSGPKRRLGRKRVRAKVSRAGTATIST
jgi:mRNA-degrading endonuclease RelE of RelBE toxin-antitoxin system